MRRDMGFYVEAGVDQVYQAYLLAAKNPPFERDCKEEPYHTIGFGVNFSMKYNMNGGSCTIHFMPWRTGTAVNMRFSIAQLAGARYERYALDLNAAMQKFMPIPPVPMDFNMDDFLKPENQVTPATIRQAAPAPRIPQEPAPYIHPAAPQSYQPAPAPVYPSYQPVPPVTPAPAPAPQSGKKFCANCGDTLKTGARFCSSCGTAVVQEKTCPACHAPVRENAAFCANCGTRL